MPSFIRDLKKLKRTSNYEAIRFVAFEEIPNCKNITEIKNLKKIKGSPNAYRIRVGDYRIGIFVKDELISFSFTNLPINDSWALLSRVRKINSSHL